MKKCENFLIQAEVAARLSKKLFEDPVFPQMIERRKSLNFHDKLISELTKMDIRNSKFNHYNPYALAQYFKAAENVVDAKTFLEAFIPSREMHSIAKRLGLNLEVEKGEWILESEYIHPLTGLPSTRRRKV
jgi:hypothetical protein